jgi:hypothetical protein
MRFKIIQGEDNVMSNIIQFPTETRRLEVLKKRFEEKEHDLLLMRREANRVSESYHEYITRVYGLDDPDTFHF